MMNNEEWEVNISALIDGELEPELLLPTLDHLVHDEECRRFYLEARELQHRLGSGDFRAKTLPLPAGMWDRIAVSSRQTKARIFRLIPGPARFWAAAAVVLFAVGIYVGEVVRPKLPVMPEEQTGTVELTLGEDQGKMSEERFVQITAELLRADRRYHRKMLEVLERVTPQPPQGSESRESRPKMADAGSSEAVPSSRRTDLSSNNPVQVRFW